MAQPTKTARGEHISALLPRGQSVGMRIARVLAARSRLKRSKFVARHGDVAARNP